MSNGVTNGLNRPSSPTNSQSSGSSDNSPRRHLTKIEVWSLGHTSYRIPLGFPQEDLDDNVLIQKPSELSAKYAILPPAYRSWFESILLNKEQSGNGQWLLLRLDVYNDKKGVSLRGSQMGLAEVHAMIGLEIEEMPLPPTPPNFGLPQRPWPYLGLSGGPSGGRYAPYTDHRRIRQLPQPDGTAISIVQVDPDDSRQGEPSYDVAISAHSGDAVTEPRGDDSSELVVHDNPAHHNNSDAGSVQNSADGVGDDNNDDGSTTAKTMPSAIQSSKFGSDAGRGKIHSNSHNPDD